MTKKKPMAWNPYLKDCPTRTLLDRIGDKWTVLILGLLVKEPVRFNMLRRQVDGVSQKVLSQVLKALERDGLVKRTAYPTVPVTVEYSITRLGANLAETVAELTQWAENHMDIVLTAQKQYDKSKL